MVPSIDVRTKKTPEFRLNYNKIENNLAKRAVARCAHVEMVWKTVREKNNPKR